MLLRAPSAFGEEEEKVVAKKGMEEEKSLCGMASFVSRRASCSFICLQKRQHFLRIVNFSFQIETGWTENRRIRRWRSQRCAARGERIREVKGTKGTHTENMKGPLEHTHKKIVERGSKQKTKNKKKRGAVWWAHSF